MTLQYNMQLLDELPSKFIYYVSYVCVLILHSAVYRMYHVVAYVSVFKKHALHNSALIIYLEVL